MHVLCTELPSDVTISWSYNYIRASEAREVQKFILFVHVYLLDNYFSKIQFLESVAYLGGGPATAPPSERKFFFRSGWKGGQTSFNGLDVRPPPPPIGLWLAGETGRTDIE
jgi:hypothetical protein